VPIASLSVCKLSKTLILTLTLVALTLSLASFAQAQTESVIYSFLPGGDLGNSSFPFAGVVRDSAGNLYGTTNEGGANNVGQVFELSPIPGGGWQENTLYTFTGQADGAYPADSLVIDSAGNLYGSAGALANSGRFGSVFKLSPGEGGQWNLTNLHTFTGGLDGGGPNGVIFDSAGNLYGTACCDGVNAQGTVFKLSPLTGGGWHFTLLHALTETDGAYPGAGLVFDSLGNLYGTAQEGGNTTNCITRPENGCGVVFKLSPTAGGNWHYTVVHAFTGQDGEGPLDALTVDASGNLYGTTFGGGASHDGVAFKLAKTRVGWRETVIHTFSGTPDGSSPYGGVTLDSLGNVYGTTQIGGTSNNGIVFEIALVSGVWTETVVHDFSGGDGLQPRSTPIFDPAGNLYGTTLSGGDNDSGTVFEITP
jgi:uncharacterized repeat protein (TIGR03803 family)